MQTRNKAFTLVELLSVVVIMGFILGISIPAMLRISQSNALGSGTRQFSDQVAMARTYALANGKDVYLFVPSAISSTTTNYAFISYGFCVSAVPSLLAADPPAQVTYIDNVRYLPEGVYFSNSTAGVQSRPFPSSTSSNTPVWWVKFNKYGQISPLTSKPKFYIRQGYVDTAGNAKAVGGNFSANEIAINPLTGKARVTPIQ